MGYTIATNIALVPNADGTCPKQLRAYVGKALIE
jgi:hypothetical protein